MIPDLDNIQQIDKMILEEDRTIRLWDFTKSIYPRTQREFEFHSGDFSIATIDPFQGVIPTLTSYETLIGKRPPFLEKTVILDSNVMTSLHQFVTAKEKLSQHRVKVISQLLDYLVMEKTDYNPAFYYVESFSKFNEGNSERAIIQYTKSILRLHMMDGFHFLKHREVNPSDEEVEKYKQKFQTSELDEMAKRQYEYIKAHIRPNTDWKVLYLIILKAALIQKIRQGSFQSKMNELNEFIYSIFGVLFSRELTVVAYYFSGKLDKFLPLQRGSNYERVLNNFRATAWDMYLLRLPEGFLASENEPIPLAVICTGDKSVQYIGRKIRIRKVFTNKDFDVPELMTDFSEIDNASSDGGKTVAEVFREYALEREARRRNLNVDEVLNKLDDIISNLENEIKVFCS
jgi:hypothetical protein